MALMLLLGSLQVILACKQSVSQLRARSPSAGGWGSSYKHWINLPWNCFPLYPGVAGFAGEPLDSPSQHYRVANAAAVGRLLENGDRAYRAGGVNPHFYYSNHSSAEEFKASHFVKFEDTAGLAVMWVNHCLTFCRLEEVGASILPEPVLPVNKSDLQIPFAAWQKLYQSCLQKEEEGVAAKCEYFRCKVHDGIVGVKKE
ncbi:unnamed protein product [Linum tenue]|uniref:Uncharacterized protein n=1 Tax=Linum tenue TaxID=586396 RepID=A0AAV0MTA7_9ROSI|nr:unnamed protein product [Linum tenue]